MSSAAECERAGQLPQAEAHYRQMLQADTSFSPAWHALGLLALRVGKLAQAIACIEQAVHHRPRQALYLRNLGEICRRAGDLDKAIACGEAACSLAPGDVDAFYNLGLACLDAQRLAEARQAYERALALDPLHGLSWNNLGSVRERQGDVRSARDAYRRAVEINPAHAEAQNNLGALLEADGALDEARACFEAAITAQPDFTAAHYNLSSLKRYRPDDPQLAMLEDLHRQRDRMSGDLRVRHCFALGKALEDVGDYDRSFAAYDEGNRLERQRQPYDEARAVREMARVLEVFTPEFFAQRRAWQGAAPQGRTPVFIVGMPRSGTTLLEQILSTHPSVHGAGEVPDLHDAIYRALGGEAVLLADGVQLLGEAGLRAIGDDYMQHLWQRAPQAALVTDKMLANFFYLGVIHLALPHAKIIHAMRDPMDSCFSCFGRLFNRTMGFAYDQGTLGRYYDRYMTLMTHWHQVLPAGAILDLPYESMVENTEAEARRVLDFVGLPWDPRCLEFHRNERVVKTASVAQVRQPIYRTSVARWKPFARHLQPLLDLVGQWRAS